VTDVPVSQRVRGDGARGNRWHLSGTGGRPVGGVDLGDSGGSGIRIGTPAITTRGFKQAEAKQVATWICDILDDIDNEEVILAVREKVSKLCAEFPVYG